VSPPAREGIPFVVSGPSGVGKTSILHRVLAADPATRFSVSHTTRPPRPGERDGHDYRFVDPQRFRALVDAGAFLEWAEYQGHLYGTSHEAVAGLTRQGIDVILEVEIQGARQLRERLGGATFVFVLPPSLEVLERRLRGRGSDADPVVRKRLERAREELREVHRYDFVIVNDDLERAVADLRNVIAACRLERDRVVARLRDRFDFG
jgi:guanylate kinase